MLRNVRVRVGVRVRVRARVRKMQLFDHDKVAMPEGEGAEERGKPREAVPPRRGNWTGLHRLLDRTLGLWGRFL